MLDSEFLLFFFILFVFLWFFFSRKQDTRGKDYIGSPALSHLPQYTLNFASLFSIFFFFFHSICRYIFVTPPVYVFYFHSVFTCFREQPSSAHEGSGVAGMGQLTGERASARMSVGRTNADRRGGAVRSLLFVISSSFSFKLLCIYI